MTTTSSAAAAKTAHTVETYNPANGERLAEHTLHAPHEALAALDRAASAFCAWRTIDISERGAHVRRVASYLREHRHRLASVITLEMGKPIAEAVAEIEKCAWSCDYFADHAGRFLADEPIASTATRSYGAFRPLGVVLAIMPWNFPFWQVFRFAVPALMAGNVGVLKHAANVTGCALQIEDVFRASGLPEGVFQTLVVAGKDMESIVASPRVAAVTLTGSEGAGSSVAATAGKHLKKTVLELGGSDPFIVLADADIHEAARIGVRARFQNTGQSCIAAKRFIIESVVYDEFLSAFVAEAAALRVGDPMDPLTQIGPLARADLREALATQVNDSVAAGATIELGGRALDGPGYFYAPTVVGGVTPGMPMFDEESFGPAAAMVAADDLDEAIALANGSLYGLSCSLWTHDVARAEVVATRLESGGLFINGMTASDPRLPFGGVKRSGYGRELSQYGIKEFVNIQTVWVGPTT